MDHYVMDIETLRNLFLVVFEHYKKDEVHVFTIGPLRNDLAKLLSFLNHNRKFNEWHISFNGLAFDSQIIHYILLNKKTLLKLTGEQVAEILYQEAQDTIARSNNMEYPKYSERQLFIRQIDLFKLNHWDSPAKSAGLKWIQCSMNWYNVQEMPLPHDYRVTTVDELKQVSSYCRNDVKSTKAIMQRNAKEISLRGILSKDYNVNLYSASEPRVAKALFLHFLSKKLNIPEKILKKKRTFRNSIVVKDILLPYIKFDVPAFQEVLENFRKIVLNPLDTRGGFKFSVKYHGVTTDFGLGGIHGAKTGIYESDEFMTIMTSDVVSYYPNLAIRNNWAPAHISQKEFTELYEWFFDERKLIPKKDPRNYVYKIILNSTYGLSNDKNCFLYDPEFTMRVTINGQLSLAMLHVMLLEGIPGAVPLMQNTDGLEVMIPRKYKDKYLDICKQWETMTKLQLEHDEYQKLIISDVNNYIAVYQFKEVPKEEWLAEMKESPENLYKRENGKFYLAKTKCKGRFEFKDMALHKNKSFLVIPKALFYYYVHGINIRDYIHSNKNIFDFCGQTKVRGSWKFIKVEVARQLDHKYDWYTIEDKAEFLRQHGWEQAWDLDNWVRTDAVNKEANTGLSTEEAFFITASSPQVTKEIIQKTLRYYISTKGVKVVKNHPDGRNIQIESGRWLQRIFNVYEELPFEEYGIDYRYFITKVENEIRALNPEAFSNQLQLNF